MRGQLSRRQPAPRCPGSTNVEVKWHQSWVLGLLSPLRRYKGLLSALCLPSLPGTLAFLTFLPLFPCLCGKGRMRPARDIQGLLPLPGQAVPHLLSHGLKWHFLTQLLTWRTPSVFWTHTSFVAVLRLHIPGALGLEISHRYLEPSCSPHC